MCGRQSRNRGGDPIFINMEILPDVKSLEDMLVHSLTGCFEHALSADLRYLGGLSCHRDWECVLSTKVDKQSATTGDMNLAHLLS